MRQCPQQSHDLSHTSFSRTINIQFSCKITSSWKRHVNLRMCIVAEVLAEGKQVVGRHTSGRQKFTCRLLTIQRYHGVEELQVRYLWCHFIFIIVHYRSVIPLLLSLSRSSSRVICARRYWIDYEDRCEPRSPRFLHKETGRYP